CSSVNLAVLLAKQDFKVCLYDADANLANVEMMLKLAPEHTLEDVISGQKKLKDITLHEAGIHIVPGASSLNDFINLTDKQQQRLLKTLMSLAKKYDYLIINNAAGINEYVLSYIKFSNNSIIVITPEPTSMTDAFELLRVLHIRRNKKELNIIVNNVSNSEHAHNVFYQFSATVKKYIGCQLNYLGHVLSDEQINASICFQNPVVLKYPTSPSALNFNDLVIKIMSLKEEKSFNKDLSSTKKLTLKQHPKFSINADLSNKELTINQPLSTEKLKAKLINSIKDKHNDQIKLKEIVQQINSAYTERFGEYVVDLPQVLHDSIKMDRISKNTMHNLIMALHGLYQEQYGISLELKPNTSLHNSKESKQKQAPVDLLIKLLQQENYTALHALHLPSQKNKKDIEDKAPNQVRSASNHHANQELLDSIYYASMVDK
ncbi:MAG: AAA family ATPase, partial [Gammaproteobacteria bacterium]|nr:AAA family ATPase [Gammaproteobacteria bacterium]